MVEINAKNRVITDIRIPFDSVITLVIQVILAHLLIAAVIGAFMFLFVGSVFY